MMSGGSMALLGSSVLWTLLYLEATTGNEQTHENNNKEQHVLSYAHEILEMGLFHFFSSQS